MVKIRRGQNVPSLPLAPLGFAAEYCTAAITVKQKPPPCDTGEGDHAEHGGRGAMGGAGKSS